MRLRVLTFNVWNEEGDPRRIEFINREVRRLDPDLVAFQEVVQTSERNQLAKLFEGTNLNGTHQSEGLAVAPAGTERYGGNAIATRWPHKLVEFILPSHSRCTGCSVVYGRRIRRFLAPRMNGQFTISSQIPDNLSINRLTLEAMKLLRHIIIVCLLATFSANAGEPLTTKAKCVVNQSTNAELQLLQGTWEGVALFRETPGGPLVKSAGKYTVTITGNSLHFEGPSTNQMVEATFTLPAGTNPRQLRTTITGSHDSIGSVEIGQVVIALFKLEDGTLTLAGVHEPNEEPPKSFEESDAKGLGHYEFRKVEPQKKMSGSGLGSLVLEGHELHASLKTRQIDDSVRHVPRAPGNPHVSTNADFVATIAKGASQGRLGREGVRSVLYALYLGKKELGFYGLEAESAADANRLEDTIRKVWLNNERMGRAQVHRKGLVLVVVWTDGVSPECWEAVNAKVVERLSAP